MVLEHIYHPCDPKFLFVLLHLLLFPRRELFLKGQNFLLHSRTLVIPNFRSFDLSATFFQGKNFFWNIFAWSNYGALTNYKPCDPQFSFISEILQNWPYNTKTSVHGHQILFMVNYFTLFSLYGPLLGQVIPKFRLFRSICDGYLYLRLVPR